MKKLLLILFVFPVALLSQPTYFASIGVPTDNSTSATSPVSFANPPIASMASGDLVIVVAYCRNASATISINNSGGQSWTTETAHQSSTATLTAQVFWCIYNGSWSAAPSFTFSSTTNTNVSMHVFRPATSTNSWALATASNTTHENSLRSAVASASFSIPQDAANMTPSQNNNITFVALATDDDNTWTLSASSTFTKMTSPAAQFRNTSGSDVSSSYAWLIQSTAANISAQNIFTVGVNGNDPAIIGFYIFYEFTPTAPTHRALIIKK